MQVPGSPLSDGDAVDPEFECPVCRQVILDPVTVLCGHTLCKRCLEAWLSRGSRCPAGCATELPRSVPAVNVVLKGLAEKRYPAELAKRRLEAEAEDAVTRSSGVATGVPSSAAVAPLAPAGGPLMPEFPAFGGAGQPAVDNALRMLFQPDRERAFLTVSSVVGGIFMTLLGVYLYPQGLTPDFFPNTHLNATSLGLPVTSPADFWELRDLHRRQADELVLLARFAPRFGLILNWVHLMSSKSPTFLSPRLFLPAMFVPRIIITLHIIVFAVSNPFFVFAVSRLLCHFTLVEVKSVHATFKELYQLRLPLVDLARMGATKLLKELQNFGTLCILIQLYTWMPWLVQDLLFAIFFVSVILGSFFESIIAGNVIYGHFRRQPVAEAIVDLEAQ